MKTPNMYPSKNAIVLSEVEMDDVSKIINDVKRLAVSYQEITGKPLGITGEVGEFMAARRLNLQLASRGQEEFDAWDKEGKMVQIKTRRVIQSQKTGQRVGSIKMKEMWDYAILILIDEMYEPLSIYKADRNVIEEELNRPGSKARNKKRSLPVSKFKSIGELVWEK